MPKPSEIFDTPEAISRVGGNEDWEDDFRKQFDELKLKPPKNSMKNAERELIIWYFRNLLTTKDQEREEAIRAETHATLTWVNIILGYKHPLEVRQLIEQKLVDLEALPTEDNN